MKWLERFKRENAEKGGKGDSVVPTGTRLRGGASEGSSAVWETGKIILGEYKVEGVLGEGGMGTVYLLVSSRFGQQRFAVKKTLLRDEATQRNFLRELQLWLDLPEHPHLAPCRFFRTVEEELVIFAEYVEGGSLAKWIAERRLTELPRLIDVAIQFAWGLQALHDWGLLHQDVKPGNVLVTLDGVVKVSDFGLARARAATGGPAGLSGREILLSCGGMTEAYCSPEQAAFHPLTQQTDVWSWGVSVLEMFTGTVNWRSGLLAEQALDAYVKRGGKNGVGADGLPLMPKEMVDMLRKCFRPKPAERWESMRAIAVKLTSLYRECVGGEYPREAPDSVRTAGHQALPNKRPTAEGGTWDHPRQWLEEALKENGSDEDQAMDLMPVREGSPRAQAVADLADYEEAERIFRRLVAKGRTDLRARLATLYQNKALVHHHLEDSPGAVAAFDQAIEIYERLVNQDGQQQLEHDLAMAYMGKGRILLLHGNLDRAVAAFDRGVEIQQRVANQAGRQELADCLAATFENKGVALIMQGNLSGAITSYDHALKIEERLVISEGRWDLAHYLASTYMNKANALLDLGDIAAAMATYDLALAIYERLVIKERRLELAEELADVYINKAEALAYQGDFAAALATHDPALAIYERLVIHGGRRDLAHCLARVYVNKGRILMGQGHFAAALATYNQALAIHERLVNQEGRRELANDLAMTYMSKGNALCQQENCAAAVIAYDEALAIQERLVNQEDQREFSRHLARTYMNKGRVLHQQGNLAGAVIAYYRAVATYERLVNQEERRELRGELAKAQLSWANLLTDPEKKVSEARRAILILEEEVRRTGRFDLAQDVEWARRIFKDLGM